MFSLNDNFSKLSQLRPDLSKFESAGKGVLTNVNIVLCDMKNVDLTKEAIKVLDLHISSNKKLQADLDFYDSIKNIVNVIRLRSMRKLTLDGKITIFKTLTISKLIDYLLRCIDYNPKFGN